MIEPHEIETHTTPARISPVRRLVRPVLPPTAGQDGESSDVGRLVSVPVWAAQRQVKRKARIMGVSADSMLEAAAGPARVEVRCLGPFRVLAHTCEVTDWKAGKARELFQYLVNHRGRLVAREALMEALWPQPDAAAPATSLKVAVHALRQSLTAAGYGSEITVETTATGYVLKAPELWLDVEHFDAHFAQGRRLDARGYDTEAVCAYQAAVGLYQGSFIEGSWADWVLLRRESLKDQYLFALARLAEAALNRRDYPGCILYCQRLLEHDCCREDSYRTIMLCHGRLGQPSRVKSWYDLCARTLRTELDATPEPATERMYSRALRGDV